MSACINAMRVLTDPADTGAVCIALPQDVEGEAYDYPEYFFQKRVHQRIVGNQMTGVFALSLDAADVAGASINWGPMTMATPPHPQDRGLVDNSD